MPRYTIRVELHLGRSDDYEELHEAMESVGFKRYVVANDGEEYQLPPGEYSISSELERAKDIGKLAREAASQTDKKFSILVTKSSGRYWDNLELWIDEL